MSTKGVEVWTKRDGRCWYCGVELLEPDMSQRRQADIAIRWFTVDHITPKSRGGRGNISNLRPACMGCNAQKNKSTVEEYRYRLGMKLSGAPVFTPEQIAYLLGIGVVFPDHLRVTFWGELNDVE